MQNTVSQIVILTSTELERLIQSSVRSILTEQSSQILNNEIDGNTKFLDKNLSKYREINWEKILDKILSFLVSIISDVIKDCIINHTNFIFYLNYVWDIFL